MSKREVHVSEAEAVSDFSSLLARVRTGIDIVIERDKEAVAVLRASEPRVRLLSTSVRLARAHGSAATLDGAFGRDLEAVVNSRREPLAPPTWD